MDRFPEKTEKEAYLTLQEFPLMVVNTRAWQKGELLKYSPEWDMATEPKFWIITLERTGNKWAFFVIKGVNWMVGGRETANGNRHD